MKELFDEIQKRYDGKCKELESSMKLVGELRYAVKMKQDELNKANQKITDLENRWAKLKEAIPK